MHTKIQDTVSHINQSMAPVKKAQKYSCLRALSIISFQAKCEYKYFLKGNSNLRFPVCPDFDLPVFLPCCTTDRPVFKIAMAQI